MMKISALKCWEFSMSLERNNLKIITLILIIPFRTPFLLKRFPIKYFICYYDTLSNWQEGYFPMTNEWVIYGGEDSWLLNFPAVVWGMFVLKFVPPGQLLCLMLISYLAYLYTMWYLILLCGVVTDNNMVCRCWIVDLL